MSLREEYDQAVREKNAQAKREKDIQVKDSLFAPNSDPAGIPDADRHDLYVPFLQYQLTDGSIHTGRLCEEIERLLLWTKPKFRLT